MAGIGFELRRILDRNTYTDTLRAYVYAGLISSGPWVLSILSVLLIGILSLEVLGPNTEIVDFLVSVTYLMAVSLTVTGGAQLVFTRFVSDRMFESREIDIFPNLAGLLCIVTLLSVALASVVMLLWFEEQSLHYRLLMVTNFVTLTNLWLVVIFLSGMKVYNRILAIMLIGYTVMVIAAYWLRYWGMNGLLTAFLIGHAFLLFAFLAEIVRDFGIPRWLKFDFLDRTQMFGSLFVTGTFYYCGIWADKVLFWFNPLTSEPVIGPLRASIIYDIPIFLAYLAIIPGMAAFLVRIETDFAEQYERLYEAIRGGEALDHVFFLKDQMASSIRQGVLEIFKIQGATALLFFLWGGELLSMLGISANYLPLLYVDVVGVSVQVVMMALFNVFFYLDRRDVVLVLSGLFFASNVLLTMLTHAGGPVYFGYGFVGATVLTTFVAIMIMNRVVRDLEYETFMMSR